VAAPRLCPVATNGNHPPSAFALVSAGGEPAADQGTVKSGPFTVWPISLNVLVAAEV
jgi:hypothetical protein